MPNSAPAMRQAVFDLGAQWAKDPARPQISQQNLSAWTQLIADAGTFIARHEDALFLGPPGTGKSLAIVDSGGLPVTEGGPGSKCRCRR